MISALDPKQLSAIAAVASTLCITAGVLVFVIRLKAREHAKRESVWRRFALDNRMNLTAGPGNWLRDGEFKIRGQLGAVDVEISTYRVQAGKSSQTWAKVRTQGPGPAGRFSLERKNLLTRAGALLGRGGVAVDGGEFDEQFLARSSPETLVRDVLDEGLRAQFAKLERSPRFTYADGVCELAWQAGDDSAEQLSAAVQLHAMLRGAFVRKSRVGAL